MSNKKLAWIGKNLSMGGMIQHAGNFTGSALNLTAKGVGELAALAVKDPSTKQSIKDSCNAAGEVMDQGLTVGGSHLGKGVNKVVALTGDATGWVAGTTAELCNASEDTVRQARLAGKVLGGAVTGFAVGDYISSVAIMSASASGLSGAAEITSGLANLGGGAIALGGGGIAVGQTVVESIVAVSAASGAACTISDQEKAAMTRKVTP